MLSHLYTILAISMKKAAGILFYTNAGSEPQILLVKRAISPGRGLWGGSGGKMDSRGTANPWKTAVRETLEEFGDCPEFKKARSLLQGGHTPLYRITNLIQVHFYTYFLKLDQIPDLEVWPSKDRLVAPDCHEWSEKGWFAVNREPLLLSPSVWWIGRYFR